MPTRIQPLSIRSILAVTIFCVIVAASTPAAERTQGATPPQRGTQNYERWLTREVGHQLIQVPWLSVFDNLQYSVSGSEVTLSGQVWQPVTKQDAETAVKGIEGVTTVINNIEVLPNSPMDDEIRRAEYRAIYGAPELQRYAMGVLPAIHIIVKNGHVTLVGTVANDMDHNVAVIRAKSVPNVFSVDDQLKVQPARG
ncbi:MAG TPA: BON domain-containing protein [Candidatus Acidoferrales bacterium]|nr:BON domain-containing protein [Candidatus Acidoferrales bacterium]